MNVRVKCRSYFMTLAVIAALTLSGVLLAATPARATDECSSCDSTICSFQGFDITLTSHSIDQLNGTSQWTYQVCNDALTCDCDASLKNDQGKCPDLSHADINLPGFGTCLNPGATVTFVQTGGFDKALLSCSVSHQDPSCDISGTSGEDFVAKCDVGGGICNTTTSKCTAGLPGDTDCTENKDCNTNLDPNECVDMKLTIAGEVPTLGKGAVDVVTKASKACGTDEICGPACPCEGQGGGECLTRTLGFWGTHPAITDRYNADLTACGTSIGDPVSNAINVLCAVPGGKDKNQALFVLKRQIAAAKLNLAATAALYSTTGNCSDEVAAALRAAGCPYSTLANIETNLCSASQAIISASKCIEGLNAFNNSQDNIPSTLSPFDRPGKADVSLCQAAK